MITILDIRLRNYESTKAFVDIDYNGLIVKGLKVVDSRNGLFVSMPREKGKDEKWYDIVYPSNLDIKLAIENLILPKYLEMKKTKEINENEHTELNW